MGGCIAVVSIGSYGRGFGTIKHNSVYVSKQPPAVSCRPQRFNGDALNENDGLEEIPDINANRDEYDIIAWEVGPGDAIAFDYRTIHGAPANTSQTAQRRAFSLRLLGDDIRFARREGIVTSPPFNQVTLQDGDQVVGDEFPMLVS